MVLQAYFDDPSCPSRRTAAAHAVSLVSEIQTQLMDGFLVRRYYMNVVVREFGSEEYGTGCTIQDSFVPAKSDIKSDIKPLYENESLVYSGV